MTRPRRSPASPLYRAKPEDPYTLELRFSEASEREAAAQKRRAAMSELHHECMALIAAGIMPPSVVRLARYLKSEILLASAMRTLTNDENTRLVAGRADLKYTAEGWKVISL
jgi:hypothetical protein